MVDYVRIIPCLDLKDGRVVKGVHFVNLRDAGDPVENASFYEKEGADEIAMLDITATVEGRKTRMDVVRNVVAAVSIPVTVGGGISSLKDIAAIIDAGASAVSISSAAFRNPSLISDAACQFGSERVIVAIDVDRNPNLPSGYEVWIDGGRTATGSDALEFARKAKELGAGQLLPTSKATDGTKEGYDLTITRAMAEATGLPVIASGGAGTMEHMYLAVVEGRASGILAASVFHFREIAIPELKKYLSERGVTVSRT
ncbi:MAG: imidazole glycerol phosphate synthase subunit HisF [bacterium]|nr:imidazole glycerol phosphate synthase subunit HisF [bacterium]